MQDTLDILYDAAVMIGDAPADAHWCLAEGEERRITFEAPLPPTFWFWTETFPRHEDHLRLTPKLVIETASPEVVDAWEANTEKLYVTAVRTEDGAGSRVLVEFVTTEADYASWFYDVYCDGRALPGARPRTRAEMLGELDLRAALGDWEAGEDWAHAEQLAEFAQMILKNGTRAEMSAKLHWAKTDA
jgi:hypothetical protein